MHSLISTATVENVEIIYKKLVSYLFINYAKIIEIRT